MTTGLYDRSGRVKFHRLPRLPRSYRENYFGKIVLTVVSIAVSGIYENFCMSNESVRNEIFTREDLRSGLQRFATQPSNGY